MTPNQEATAEGRRAMIGQRNAGRQVQRDGPALTELPVGIAMEAGAQANQPASDKKESL